MPPPSPYQEANAVSKTWTYTDPMSRRTHSSNTSITNRPYCSGETERWVTSEPSWTYRGRPRTPLPQPASAICRVSGVARSMIGMNWMNDAPSSSRR